MTITERLLSDAAGCRWVKFDRDGPEIDGIERYQW